MKNQAAPFLHYRRRSILHASTASYYNMLNPREHPPAEMLNFSILNYQDFCIIPCQGFSYMLQITATMTRFFCLTTAVATALLLSCCCCQRCLGTGEITTQYSSGACPYCGGSGGWNVSPTPFSDQEW